MPIVEKCKLSVSPICPKSANWSPIISHYQPSLKITRHFSPELITINPHLASLRIITWPSSSLIIHHQPSHLHPHLLHSPMVILEPKRDGVDRRHDLSSEFCSHPFFPPLHGLRIIWGDYCGATPVTRRSPQQGMQSDAADARVLNEILCCAICVQDCSQGIVEPTCFHWTHRSSGAACDPSRSCHHFFGVRFVLFDAAGLALTVLHGVAAFQIASPYVECWQMRLGRNERRSICWWMFGWVVLSVVPKGRRTKLRRCVVEEIINNH